VLPQGSKFRLVYYHPKVIVFQVVIRNMIHVYPLGDRQFSLSTPSKPPPAKPKERLL
jgi:hypothetical protein